ncbi:MAG: FAD-dependent oxidoreductase [Deltaproteobacteria bacterium]|nr:FAD-dependent oxidoreductase [Deltaproteobacteria bacterium]
MEQFDFVVVGAGVSGLSFANWAREEASRLGRASPTILVVEREREPGGYCRTVKRHGFTWDFAGHFFHFRHADIEAWLRARMSGAVRTVERSARVRTAPVPGSQAVEVDYPFQRHLQQLDQIGFIACLADLYQASKHTEATPPASFKEMLTRRFGAAMCERFLTPYNEKLYACDLDTLEVDAMGRFFPHASLDEVLAGLTTPAGERAGYNATFQYPEGGAAEFVRALVRDLPERTLALDEQVQHIDLERRVVTTSQRKIRYGQLVTSAPLPATLTACGLEHDQAAFTSNRVLVFNLGFDKKGRKDVHWIYVADPARIFYRVGFYDNIVPASRMSLYVEVGLPAGSERPDVGVLQQRVLADLAAEGIVQPGQKLVAHHHVVMNPAYVHLTARSVAEAARARADLERHGVYSVGRYGGWTYCAIEDNLVETRALAARLLATNQ